ncbi:carbohydrate ABC transporter permease [Microlunatus parietis]|uniref:ABC-type sugar transport system permease subunit n=1 Tax=Microlunatus parietis TaxID=682979 RepID=A0A7Y9IAW4_9ACTN|nr:sugar ABC transporter permease [Microlunatus parietis]NYE73312.1 ABC-type sugar transport system permease subunit [Microlunatus parietis]
MNPTTAPVRSTITPTQRVIGALLIIPALILWLVQLVVPSIRTLIMSLQQVNPLRARADQFVGLEFYERLLPEIVATLPRALIFTGPAILIAIVVGLAVGPLVARGTRPVRLITRGMLGLLLVCYAPVGVALTFDTRAFADPGTAGLALAGIVTVSVLATAGAAAALVSIAAWRSASGPATWLATAALTLAVGLGLAMQLFAVPYVLTAGGPNHSTETPLILGFVLGFMQMQFGGGAAVAVVTGLFTGLFGLLAVLIILVARLRVEIDPPGTPDRGSGLGWVGLGVAGVFLVITIVLIVPWLAGSARPVSPDLPAGAVINTWLPPLLGALIQLVVALAAGFGLGALRPLGRASEWALLIFAPWLLVGPGLLALQHFDFLRTLGLLNTFPGLLPQAMINIPAVVGFTLLFAGARRLRDSGAPAGAALAPVLGGTLTTFVLLWVIQAQDLIIGYVSGTRPDSMTGPVLLAMARNQRQFSGAGDLPQALSTPLPLIVVLGLASIAIQALCLDRLRLATGRPAPSAPTTAPATTPPVAPR